MPHQDMTSETTNHEAIKQAVDQLMPVGMFNSLKMRKGATWRPRMLVAAAFIWGCLPEPNLERRFNLARGVVDKIFRWFAAPGKTYEGFKKVLKSRHQDIKILLMENWRDQMKLLPSPWTVEGYLVLGVDGSRVELPRTVAHEEHFSSSRKSKRKTKKRARRAKRQTKAERAAIAKKQSTPQMWLTLLWEAGTGLPWDWKVGPSDSSERDHLREMLAELPPNTLITADSGFVGYDFWKSILDAGQQFIIRVGANVTLLKNLGHARQHGQTVYLWPSKAMKKKQPPLMLRLIELHNGKEPVYLVTNLLKSELSDAQAAVVYRARWGIEVFFRTLKQTFRRGKLRSKTPEYAELELDWALLGLWGMLLVGQQELAAAGQPPGTQSPAKTIEAFQAAIHDYRLRPTETNLWRGLRAAVLDGYERSSDKTSRSYPRKKQRARTSPPKIELATKEQRKAARNVPANPKIQLAA